MCTDLWGGRRGAGRDNRARDLAGPQPAALEPQLPPPQGSEAQEECACCQGSLSQDQAQRGNASLQEALCPSWVPLRPSEKASPAPGRTPIAQGEGMGCRQALACVHFWAAGHWGGVPAPSPVLCPTAPGCRQRRQSSRLRVEEGPQPAPPGTARGCGGWGRGRAGTAQVWGETRRLCGPWFCPQWGRGCQCCPQPPGCWVHMGLVAPGAQPNQMSQILSIPGSIPPWAPGARHIPGSLFSSVKWARCSSPGNQGWQGPSQAAPHHRGPWAWLSSHYSATACR